MLSSTFSVFIVMSDVQSVITIWGFGADVSTNSVGVTKSCNTDE